MNQQRSGKLLHRSEIRSKALHLGVLSLRFFIFVVSLIAAATIFNLSFIAQASAQVPDTDNKVLVKEIIGSETIDLVEANGAIEKIRAGHELRVGNKVATGKGVMAKLTLFDGSQFTLGQNSEFLVEARKANRSVGAQWHFKLFKGAIHGIVNRLQERKLANDQQRDIKIKIRTKSAAMGIRGTDFIYAFLPEDERTEIYTSEGEVEFSKSIDFEPEKTVIVRGGEWSYADSKMAHPRQPASIDFTGKIKDVLIRFGFLAPQEAKAQNNGASEETPLHTIEDCLQTQFMGWRYKDGNPPHLGICFK